jgi:aconitase B
MDRDPAEQKAAIELAQAARGKGPGLIGAQPLITRRQAVEFIAPILGIENVDAAMEALEAEDAVADQKAADAQAATEAAQNDHLHKLADAMTNGDGEAQPRGARGASGKEPKAPSAGGGSGTPTASKEA